MNIPKKFIETYLPKVEGLKVFNQPVEKMSKKELMSCIGFLLAHPLERKGKVKK